MPMTETKVRFASDVLAAVKIAAKHKGETVAEYIRIATLSRAAYDAGRRGDEVTEGFDRLWEAAAELVRSYDLDEP